MDTILQVVDLEQFIQNDALGPRIAQAASDPLSRYVIAANPALALFIAILPILKKHKNTL